MWSRQSGTDLKLYFSYVKTHFKGKFDLMHNKCFVDFFFLLVMQCSFLVKRGDVFAFAMCARKLITPAENSSSVGKRMRG